MNIDKEFKIAPKISSNRNKDSDDDDELSVDQLQILINQLNFQDDTGSFPKRLTALQTFSDYLENHEAPPEIIVQLQNSIVQIVQQENPPEINLNILSIINIIYGSFVNGIPLDYEALVTFIWNLLPLDEAFDALSLITYQNLTVAQIVIQNKDTIFEWLNDPEYIKNALILINSLVRHNNMDIQTEIVPYVTEFLQLSQTLDTDNLPILYSILKYFTNTKGLSKIKDYEMLGTLFDRAFESPDVFFEALRFVEEVNKCVSDPILFMDKANALIFFEKSLNSEDKKIFKEGLKLCYTVAETKSGVQYMIESQIVDKLFSLIDSNFDISSLALKIICCMVSGCSPEFIPQFLEKNLMDIITLYLPTSERNCQFEILKCLQTIVLTFQSTGNPEYIQEIATNDLEAALTELKELNSPNDHQIQTLAHYVYAKIFPQE